MKRAEHQPEQVVTTLYAGIYIKTWEIMGRDVLIPQHAHIYPHLSHIVFGAVRVWCNDKDLGRFASPTVIKIPAYTLHRFLTLTDRTVIACIHNADHIDADGEPAVTEASRAAAEAWSRKLEG